MPQPRTPYAIFLGLVATLTRPLLFALTVTGTLALYFALFKVGDPMVLPRMLRFVGLQFTPWFVLGHEVARLALPDLRPERATNLLLPVVEAVGSVLAMSALLSLGLALDNPYLNTALLALQLIASVVLARLWVRRTFRH